jgi:DNA invertase Pin-like site-specific DNA recombinase
MIAAIYARKSTEQTGTAEEAKSVTRQIDHVRAYAAMKGWMVAAHSRGRRARVAGGDAETKRQQVEAEQGRLATELAQLTEAIAAGGGVTLVTVPLQGQVRAA